MAAKDPFGVSIRVVAPTGQYDPAKLINYGSNRWAFKPEIGLSQRRGHWVVDTYGGGGFSPPTMISFRRIQLLRRIPERKALFSLSKGT